MDNWYSLPGFHDPMSSMSHLAGAMVFAILSIFLLRPVWRQHGRFWCLAIFALSAVTLLSLSAVFHMVPLGGTARAVMLRLDVAAIFVLIAGSFTPIHGILFTGWKRWGMLLLIWLIAIMGVTLRTIFFNNIPGQVGIGIFLLMGWVGAVSAYLLWHEYGFRVLIRVVAGGAPYTLGAAIDLARWPSIIPYVWGPHETFHLAVLAGLSCHWWVAWQIAEGRIGR